MQIGSQPLYIYIYIYIYFFFFRFFLILVNFASCNNTIILYIHPLLSIILSLFPATNGGLVFFGVLILFILLRPRFHINFLSPSPSSPKSQGQRIPEDPKEKPFPHQTTSSQTLLLFLLCLRLLQVLKKKTIFFSFLGFFLGTWYK